MAGLTGWHLLIVLGVVVLLFGAKKLPEMARSVGQSARILKGEMKGMAADDQARAGQSPTGDGPGGAVPLAEPPVSPAGHVGPTPAPTAPEPPPFVAPTASTHDR